MIKQVDLFSKKPGMSMADFKQYYETRHVPLLMQYIPRFAHYRRNFVIPGADVEAGHIADQPPPPDFDVITEVWFEDQATFDKLIDDLKDPAIGGPIARDEENFFDRGRMVIFAMEEHATPEAHLGSAAGAPDDGSMVKMVCMIRRRPGMTRDAFIEYYETRHAPLTVSHLPMIARYHRSYMIPGSAFDAGHIADAPPLPEIDVMTEMWFRTKADHDALLTALRDPALAKIFAADEENLFDRASIQMFLVDECVTPTSVLAASARARGY